MYAQELLFHLKFSNHKEPNHFREILGFAKEYLGKARKGKHCLVKHF